MWWKEGFIEIWQNGYLFSQKWIVFEKIGFGLTTWQEPAGKLFQAFICTLYVVNQSFGKQVVSKGRGLGPSGVEISLQESAGLSYV